jgi:hypothetical protein
MSTETPNLDAPGSEQPEPEFTRLPDLASRALGGSVVWANDELFAERENLIKVDEPSYSTYTFGHKGQIYDGWKTRRRREPGYDWALIRLGVPGAPRQSSPRTPASPEATPRRRSPIGRPRRWPTCPLPCGTASLASRDQ